ncbi:MAG: hypothetical protein HUU35_13715, partial [Armatimonadetes bacterium]|nr:hypothetical protein [Armatimonadota bacterium]
SIAGAGAVVASPERTAAVQKALQQLQATRAALLLAEPRSQEQLEAATASLQLAIEALQPQEVKE